MALLPKCNSPISKITKSSFKHALLLMFLVFLNFTTTEASDIPVFLRENCTTKETFTANSTFQYNLRTLLSSLASNAKENTEFHNTTVSGGSPFDTVYGLFMCRGDVAPELCQKCVVNATQRLGNQGSDTCPFAKGAIIWYDECMVRYSNKNFFSTMDTRPRMRLRNTGNVTNPESFMTLLFTTLNQTADEAANSSDGVKAYATKQAKISGFQTLYCLVQCTPDLSPKDCRSCLSEVIGDLPWCCPGKQGGRVLYPSCNFREENYVIRDRDCDFCFNYYRCADVVGICFTSTKRWKELSLSTSAQARRIGIRERGFKKSYLYLLYS